MSSMEVHHIKNFPALQPQQSTKIHLSITGVKRQKVQLKLQLYNNHKIHLHYWHKVIGKALKHLLSKTTTSAAHSAVPPYKPDESERALKSITKYDS